MNNNGLKNLSEIISQNESFSIGLNNNDPEVLTNFSNNQAFQVDTDDVTLSTDESKKKKNVRLIYCSDGILEECEEDEIEKERLEREERERIIEQRKQLEIEAVNLCEYLYKDF